MRFSTKATIITAVAALTFPLGATPALATAGYSGTAPVVVASEGAGSIAQTLVTDTVAAALPAQAPLESVLSGTLVEVESAPQNFDVQATIAQAESEIGTSRPTGWSQPGECLMSAQRWILAGGGAWTGSGNPVANYAGATRMTLGSAKPGDIVQYEYASAPTAWVTGVHTVMITEVNDDGTFTIIESNNPGGTGLVQKQ